MRFVYGVDMASATLLLQLALSLLIAAQQPNVPEDLKIRAISTAEYAISVALEAKEEQEVFAQKVAVNELLTCEIEVKESTDSYKHVSWETNGDTAELKYNRLDLPWVNDGYSYREVIETRKVETVGSINQINTTSVRLYVTRGSGESLERDSCGS